MTTSNPVARPVTELAFRRQFYLADVRPAALAGWKSFDAGSGLRLCVHPELGAVQHRDGADCLTLLGFALDAADPEADDAAILRQLWPLRADPDGLWRETGRLGGRWALIVHQAGRTTLMHDATGARQVCYARIGGKTVCASQPALLAELHALDIDAEAQAFVRARGDSDLDVYWLPGDRTLYSPVRFLLPNHVLGFESGAAKRVWPMRAMPSAPAAGGTPDVLDRVATMLRGFMRGAQRRFGRLAVPMTAGLDSRLVLAMCQPVRDDLYCYTLIYPNHSRANRDVAVPARLLPQLGLAHHVLSYPRVVDEELRAVCQRSTCNGHDAFCADVQPLRDHYPKGALCLTGDVAEIVKCHFRLAPDHAGPVTPADLAALCGIPLLPFSREALQHWLDGVPADLPLPLLDLFCWEQMAGRWQAMIRAEYDMVQDSLAPLNCRALLLDLLSLDEGVRGRPGYPAFVELIGRLWPQTLAEPINPPVRESLAFRVMHSASQLRLQRLLPNSVRGKLRELLSRV